MRRQEKGPGNGLDSSNGNQNGNGTSLRQLSIKEEKLRDLLEVAEWTQKVGLPSEVSDLLEK